MKNKKLIIRIAVLCCAVLMLSVVGIGYTLAKYVKSESKAEETASVAKFGVEMTWTKTEGDDDAFAVQYDADDTASGVALAVKGTSDKIAPGTTGMIVLTVSGTAEVAFNLTIDIDEEYSDNWKESALTGAKDYHPIALSATSSFGTVSIVDGKINVKNFEPNATLAGTVTITWAWAFEGENDAADTYMSSVENATYSLAATAIATQID